MRHWILFSLLILSSCQTPDGEDKETAEPQKAPKKMFAGNPDLPTSETQITSAGIGKVILGDPLDKLDHLYDSVVTLTIQKAGGEWQAKKIILSEDQYILAESVNAVNQITGIYTNSRKIKTKEGYYIGMPLDSIQFTKDSIAVYPNQKSILLYNSGIQFRINRASEKNIYSTDQKSVKNFPDATIEEFFIICGDC